MTSPPLSCETHGEPTRISCVDCGTPICPKCMVRTEVGTKCEKCAKPVEAKITAVPKSKLPLYLGIGGTVLVLGAIVAIALKGGGSSNKPTPPAAVVGHWTPAAPLSSIRGTTSVVQLRNGQILAAGGGVGSLVVSTAELYDPATQRWSMTGSMVSARRGANAVLLPDGRVLVAGGIGSNSMLLSSAEIYDPRTGKWTATGSMSIPRLDGTMTALPSGDVLIAGGTTTGGTQGTGGGQTISPTNTAELFKPSTGTWTGTQPMADARFEASAVALTDGRVLIMGGLGGAPVSGPTGVTYNALSSAEIFDPAVDVFTGAGKMTDARTLAVATRLQNGQVLVAGGLGGLNGTQTLSTAELFNPRTGGWSAVPPMTFSRTGAVSDLLNNGSVLVAGGETVDNGERRSLGSAEVFNPTSDAWQPAGTMTCPRSGSGVVTLSNGSVLVVAGDTAFPGQAPVASNCVDSYAP